MSEIIAPVKWEELTLPVSSLSPDKWHFSENEKTGLEKMIVGLGLLGTVFGFLFLFGRLGPFPKLMDGAVFFISFFAVFGIAVFTFSKISKHAVATRERKRDEYRAQHASSIIDALAEQGWTVFGHNPVATLIKDNNPYLLNENGVRYYARQLYIGRENIIIMLHLSDQKVEQNIRETEKQRRIEFEINVYEGENGPMTPEEKAAFVAALTIVL
jgi:hypothetical protein